MSFIRHKILFLLVCTALIASSCGGPAQTDSEIATAVALTVQAQESPTQVPAHPTLTPVPTFQAEASPEPDPTSTPQPVVSNPGCTVSASLVSENPPDDVLLKPGEYFWKTWTLLNTGSCIWDNTYSLVFWSGERMGGLSSYPLTEIVRPEETLEISIYLQAPSTEGTSTGYWRLKSPWGADFGVGPLSSSFYAQIGVAEKPKYGIAKVAQELIRDPATGCPANVRYTVYATITSNGPLEFEYYWEQSDGNESGIRTLKLTEAGSVTVEREWMLGRGATQNPRWIQFIITAPQYQAYERMIFLNNCP
jgi:hypothetical protein